jgi:copper homeostasis protein
MIKSPGSTLVEIAVHTIDSALAAQAGGAHRVELFSNPLEGGVTPSEGLTMAVRKHVTVGFHVLIRPRGGDFCYSSAEFNVMLHDIAAAKRMGANGIVLGIVNSDGTVDVSRLRELLSAARPLPVTFHRAFDMCRDLPASLETLIECGVDRVLTSGGEATAEAGIPMLTDLVARAAKRIVIMAAGGIRAANVCEIVARTGVSEVHAGLRSQVPGPMQFHNPKVSFGPAMSEYERLEVMQVDVRQLVQELSHR